MLHSMSSKRSAAEIPIFCHYTKLIDAKELKPNHKILADILSNS